MAILVAIATYTPNMEVRLILLGNVKLKYIAIFFVLLDVLFLDKGNPGGRLAHIGGALVGYFYSASLMKGNDWSRYFYGFVNFFRDLVAPRKQMKVVSRNAGAYAKSASSNSRSAASGTDFQRRMDAILDKISQSGYDSLTKEEKEFLFNASKK
jgi:hypothetical protein